MGAYNSKRHATTGFSPYMLTRGTEKAISINYLYPEFTTISFGSHEEYVDHIIAMQQEIHDLVRSNKHEVKQCQNLTGEPVWVFCCYIPQKGTSKLLRASRGPHKSAQVLQERRVYILDSGRKVQFERLNPPYGGSTE